jgi:hypothetical protein
MPAVVMAQLYILIIIELLVIFSTIKNQKQCIYLRLSPRFTFATMSPILALLGGQLIINVCFKSLSLP